MRIFQFLLVAVWIVVAAVTLIALDREGLAASVDVFSADLDALGWRAQFNVDLLAHFALVGLWAAWRDRFSLPGIAAGLCCLFGGSLFSFLYLLVLTAVSRGDFRRVLLGRHYVPAV